MQTFCVGKKYPMSFRKPTTPDWGVVNIFNNDGFNSILIGLKNINESEINQLRNGNISIGVFYCEPVILIVVDVGFASFDCSLDMKLYANPVIVEQETSESRMLIEFHCIDSENEVLKVLRAFTIPPELTGKLIALAHKQLSLSYTSSVFTKSLLYIQQCLPISTIIAKTKMYEVGT